MKRVPQRVLKTRTLFKLSRQDREDLRQAVTFALDQMEWEPAARARFEALQLQLSEEIAEPHVFRTALDKIQVAPCNLEFAMPDGTLDAWTAAWAGARCPLPRGHSGPHELRMPPS